ncbi:PDR/VanB family oxidoreductase [Mycobacterium sp. NAZ190054]|uniref:PDR/VanB family oxidoreductase n=1 Tax=Mycobacterium sp. NAZ190054 TaxID=1747766 RepID=UPI00079909A6|nr:PDR/VanB family oxidoreductase [Mycobacterium sp. NAZ190054]KWX57359.1 ferredoxin [Mycobacterium sp. NAZ190054]
MEVTELPVRVVAREEPAAGVVVLQLAPDNGDLPPWEPGAHVDIVSAEGECRQYSLCGTGESAVYRIAVLEEPKGRGFSRLIHREAVVGSRWRMRGPRSNFAFRPARRYIFIAGGIGITPLLPMLAAAEAAGAEWTLHYGGRSRASMAFLDELVVYGDRVRVLPQDEVGLLPVETVLAEPADDTLIYCCGPEPLLRAVEAGSGAWPAGALRVERFTPRELEGPLRDTAFEVELRRSGQTITVEPGTSILEAVANAGVPTLSACQEGTCGTCETAVLDGVPDHRDSVLDPEERAAGDYMMICISRSCTDRLVLDL